MSRIVSLVFLSHIELQFIAVSGIAVGVGSMYLYLLVSRFLYSIGDLILCLSIP